MQEYNFKVIAELKPDLSLNEQQFMQNKLQELQQKLSVKQVAPNMYCHAAKNSKEFGAVCMFYLQLEKCKQYFCQLAYYDYLDNESEIAV